jgi:hypothetical protein
MAFLHGLMKVGPEDQSHHLGMLDKLLELGKRVTLRLAVEAKREGVAPSLFGQATINLVHGREVVVATPPVQVWVDAHIRIIGHGCDLGVRTPAMLPRNQAVT